MSIKITYKALPIVAYAFLFYFLYFIINPLCYNIFQQPAFVVTANFFQTTIAKPGGLAEYLSIFVEQFTMFRFWGALFLVAEIFLIAWLTNRFVRNTIVDNQHLQMLLHILVVAFACITYIDVKYALAINMKALLLIAALNLHQFFSKYNWQKYIIPLLAIAVYMACGPVALYTYSLCCIVLYFVKQDKPQLINMVSVLVVSAIVPFLVFKFILPISAQSAFYLIVPQKFMYTVFKFHYTQLLMFLFVILAMVAGIAFTRTKPVKRPILLTFSVIVIIAVGSYFLTKKHDNFTERVATKMQVAAYNSDWDKILEYANKDKLIRDRSKYERYINYYFDMALAAKHQLPEKMFASPHLLGVQALFVNDPIATVVCLPAAMQYKQVGFITNALHYAFEAQTTYTMSHYVMRYVIDCMLIIGDYQNAEIFLNRYSDVMFSKKYVNDRRQFLAGNPNTELKEAECEELRQKHPKVDFYMGSTQYDLLQVLNIDSTNYIANQYLLTSALLKNDLETFVNLILLGVCKVNTDNLPKLYQEAILLYWATAENVKPETSNFKVAPFLKDSFNEFTKIMSSKSTNKKAEVARRFPNSYWKYYYFDNPEVTHSRLITD